MMYPALARFRFEELGASIVPSRIVGPARLFVLDSPLQIFVCSLLGWIYLAGLPGLLGLETEALAGVRPQTSLEAT